MYCAVDGRTDARPGFWSAGVLAAGRAPGAVAAAARAGPQRPPGPRADQPDRPSATPGVLPPGPAAGRTAGIGAAQFGRRARRLLHRGPRPLRRAAGGGGRDAASGARPGPAPGSRAPGARTGAVLVYRQRRPLPDGRGAGAATFRRPGAGIQRRQPPQVAAPEHGPRHGRARDRRPRAARQAPERFYRGAVRLRDHLVRPGPRGLPGVSRPSPAHPLEHSRSGRGRGHRRGELPGLPGHRGRARVPARLPARRDRRHAGPFSPPGGVMTSPHEMVNVRYMVDDVQTAVDFYTGHLGFALRFSAAPAFADVSRGNLRLLLAGPSSSAGRPMPDGREPGPGGWNRIHFIVDDIEAEVARLRAEGVSFRNEIVTGPGGKQILAEDPSGNVVELFQPAASRA